MTTTERKPLRLWPPIAIAVLFVLVVTLGPVLLPEEGAVMPMLGGAVCALLIVLWWLFFSRAKWSDRLGALAAMAAGVVVTRQFVHLSIDNGAQGYLAFVFGFMFFAAALAVWAVATARLSDGVRRLALVPVLLLVGFAPMMAIRTEGVMGGGFVLRWRWTPTPEQELLARGEEELKPLTGAQGAPGAQGAQGAQGATDVPGAQGARGATGVPSALRADAATVRTEAPGAPSAPSAPSAPMQPEWPGFRGVNRDGVVRNVRISTDWQQSPPAEIWRRAIGPGWSSFSVRGDLLYTQEQRGDEEIVSCYRVSTGEPVWRHRDSIRFYESNGGAGPRGTPTIHGDRIFALGATGRLNALDAESGRLLWAHDAAADTKRAIPMWGISSSPLVVGDVVIVSLYGTLAGYDVVTGALRWVGPQHGGSYSSPHLLTVDGVTQVVILSAPGAVSVNPADGSLFWEHRWEGGAIVQPAITADGDILINGMAATGGVGTRRLAITHSGDQWSVEERWTSIGLKPYFNDLVVHKGHAYGFDGAILSSIDLNDGVRKWKGGRYGNGQMVLLAEQDLLLVISEEGELALVSATPDRYQEIARVPALNAKTWNHPVIVRDVLLVRNGEEMAAFRLPLVEPRSSVER